jgi:hypothetical protein
MKLTSTLLSIAIALSLALSGCSKKESSDDDDDRKGKKEKREKKKGKKGDKDDEDEPEAKGSAAPVEAKTSKGLAAADNDPALAAWGKEVAGCKEFNTSCSAYTQKNAISKGDDASKAKARTTMFNWMEEPSNAIVRHAGAHVLWSEWLINDAVTTDTKLFERTVAALKAEPGYGKENSNKYAATQMANVLAKFSKSAPNRPAIANFIGDKSYPFVGARVEALRLLPDEAFNDATVFATIQRIGEDTSEPSEMSGAIVSGLRDARDGNRAWAKTYLRKQFASTEASRASSAAQSLAPYGEGSDADALFAAIETRSSEFGFVGGACLAAREYMRRTDVSFDKAKAVKSLAKIVRDEKAGSVARLWALEGVYEARDPQTVALGTLLSGVKEESIAKQAKEIVEKYKKNPKK